MWLTIVICLYFLPTLIAFVMRKEGAIAIFFVNFLGGWTGLVWIVALCWAAMADQRVLPTGIDFTCKKCGRKYNAPNEHWYGVELICSKCDNFLKVRTPTWRFIWKWAQSWGLGIALFVWLYIITIYHFSHYAQF